MHMAPNMCIVSLSKHVSGKYAFRNCYMIVVSDSVKQARALYMTIRSSIQNYLIYAVLLHIQI
jgi:hypothetical protein